MSRDRIHRLQNAGVFHSLGSNKFIDHPRSLSRIVVALLTIKFNW